MKEDNRIKKLILKLANEISNSIYNTTAIQDILDEINQEGYEIDIVLAARLDLYRKAVYNNYVNKFFSHDLKFEFDKFDLEFLKELHLKVED